MKSLNTVIGTRVLCAWQPVPGVTRVQTLSARHARRLAKRRDGRLVAIGVAGGYLRTFEFLHPLSWAERLIRRYHASATPAKAAKTNLGAWEKPSRATSKAHQDISISQPAAAGNTRNP